MIKIRNSVEELHSKLDTNDGRICKLEDEAGEIIQTTDQRANSKKYEKESTSWWGESEKVHFSRVPDQDSRGHAGETVLKTRGKENRLTTKRLQLF